MSDLAQNDRAVRGGNSGIDASHLTAFVERLESVNARIKDEQEARKEIKDEAKSMGFSVKAINEVIKLRAMDPNERHEQETTLDVYKIAMGL